MVTRVLGRPPGNEARPLVSGARSPLLGSLVPTLPRGHAMPGALRRPSPGGRCGKEGKRDAGAFGAPRRDAEQME